MALVLVGYGLLLVPGVLDELYKLKTGHYYMDKAPPIVKPAIPKDNVFVPNIGMGLATGFANSAIDKLRGYMFSSSANSALPTALAGLITHVGHVAIPIMALAAGGCLDSASVGIMTTHLLARNFQSHYDAQVIQHCNSWGFSGSNPQCVSATLYSNIAEFTAQGALITFAGLTVYRGAKAVWNEQASVEINQPPN
jgi:hypothetical protein